MQICAPFPADTVCESALMMTELASPDSRTSFPEPTIVTLLPLPLISTKLSSPSILISPYSDSAVTVARSPMMSTLLSNAKTFVAEPLISTEAYLPEAMPLLPSPFTEAWGSSFRPDAVADAFNPLAMASAPGCAAVARAVPICETT